MSDRELILANEDRNNVFPYIVYSHFSYNQYEKPYLIEAFSSKDEALARAKYRHDSGYVINIYENIAYTVG